MEFECGATVTFTMSRFTLKNRRVLQVQGTKGELFLDDDQDLVEVSGIEACEKLKIVFAAEQSRLEGKTIEL